MSERQCLVLDAERLCECFDEHGFGFPSRVAEWLSFSDVGSVSGGVHQVDMETAEPDLQQFSQLEIRTEGTAGTAGAVPAAANGLSAANGVHQQLTEPKDAACVGNPHPAPEVAHSQQLQSPGRGDARPVLKPEPAAHSQAGFENSGQTASAGAGAHLIAEGACCCISLPCSSPGHPCGRIGSLDVTQMFQTSTSASDEISCCVFLPDPGFSMPTCHVLRAMLEKRKKKQT